MADLLDHFPDPVATPEPKRSLFSALGKTEGDVAKHGRLLVRAGRAA